MLHPDYVAQRRVFALIDMEIARRGGDEPLSRIRREIARMRQDAPQVVAACRPWMEMPRRAAPAHQRCAGGGRDGSWQGMERGGRRGVPKAAGAELTALSQSNSAGAASRGGEFTICYCASDSIDRTD